MGSSDVKAKARENGKKRLSPSEWRRAEIMWGTGRYTYDDLAEHFGVNKNSVYNHMKRRGISKGQDDDTYKQVEINAHQKAYEDSYKELAETGSKVRETALKSTHFFQALITKATREAINKGQSIAVCTEVYKAAKDGIQAMQMSYKTAEMILHYDKEVRQDEELPTLSVDVFDQDSVEDIRQQQQLEADIMNGQAIEEPIDDSLPDLED